jgi:prevent-host-death family protein
MLSCQLQLTSQMTSLYNGFSVKEGNLASWQVQDAKARFSEFLDATIKKGPQVVTRRGVKTAVLVPIEEWERLQKAARPGLKEWLLAPEPRFDNLIPERRKGRRRPVVEFE